MIQHINFTSARILMQSRQEVNKMLNSCVSFNNSPDPGHFQGYVHERLQVLGAHSLPSLLNVAAWGTDAALKAGPPGAARVATVRSVTPSGSLSGRDDRSLRDTDAPAPLHVHDVAAGVEVGRRRGNILPTPPSRRRRRVRKDKVIGV